MKIKQQIINEVQLRKKLRGEDKMTYRKLAKECNMSYNSLLKWVNGEPQRGITINNLEKVAEKLGKKLILVDLDV